MASTMRKSRSGPGRSWQDRNEVSPICLGRTTRGEPAKGALRSMVLKSGFRAGFSRSRISTESRTRSTASEADEVGERRHGNSHHEIDEKTFHPRRKRADSWAHTVRIQPQPRPFKAALPQKQICLSACHVFLLAWRNGAWLHPPDGRSRWGRGRSRCEEPAYRPSCRRWCADSRGA